jgi:16S rRNA (guanine527-N7)-methyltransferase
MSGTTKDRIKAAVSAAGLASLDEVALARLAAYTSLMLRWNSRMNLTAVRSEEGIVSRHIVESVDVVLKLPREIQTLLDFGSGAGFPGLPIAICRTEIGVTLSESQNKKAAFLMEAVRVLRLGARVHSGRAEELKAKFDCVTLRAVDRMAEAVSAASALVAPGGWLALMTTASSLEKLKISTGSAALEWTVSAPLHGSDQRLLALGRLPPA